MKILKSRWWLAAAAAVAIVVSAVLTTVASVGANAAPSKATAAQAGGLGQKSGLLPRDKLTLESALQVNLSKETVRLPLYPGTARRLSEGLVRPSGRLRCRAGARPGRELRAQARQHRDQ